MASESPVLSATSKIGWGMVAAGAALALYTRGNMRITGAAVTTLGIAAMAYGVSDVRANSDRLSHYENWINKKLHNKYSSFIEREVVTRVAYASLMIYGTGFAASYEISSSLMNACYFISGANKSLEPLFNDRPTFPSTLTIAHRELIKTINPNAKLSTMGKLLHFELNDEESFLAHRKLDSIMWRGRDLAGQEQKIWQARGVAIEELCLVIIAEVTSLVSAVICVIGSAITGGAYLSERAERETTFISFLPLFILPFTLLGVCAPTARIFEIVDAEQ